VGSIHDGPTFDSTEEDGPAFTDPHRLCGREMAWLSHHGIAFEERDITQNEQWMDELMALGASATPTTVIE